MGGRLGSEAQRVWHRRSLSVTGLCIVALASCSFANPQDPPAPGPAGGLVIEVEDVVAPDVFALEAEAAIAAETDGAGIWAAAPGLAQPERASLESAVTGRSSPAALFPAPGASPIISSDAARALGIEPAGTTPVHIRAIRSEFRLARPPTGF